MRNLLIEDISEKMQYLEEVTEKLGDKLTKDRYIIEDMGCPHKQPKFKPGWGAIYIFVHESNGQFEFLKIGKVNTKSAARFVSQHYGFSAQSTLAKSLCSDEHFVSLGVNRDNVKNWMLENLHRINIYVKGSKASTELIEAVLHYTYRPRYEGNI